MLTSTATATITRGTTATSTRAITQKPPSRAERSSGVAIAEILLAAGVLIAIGGAYEPALLPALIAAAALFVVSGARVGADADCRALDGILLLALAVPAIQLVPLPPRLLEAISPAARTLQDAYALEPFGGWRPVSIDPAATRSAMATALTGALVFWGARDAFARGGTRTGMRLLAAIGAGCSVVALAQHVTAPRTILWAWHAVDPRATPFGPFIDRNHLATWLILAISAVSGYVVARSVAHLSDRNSRGAWAVTVALTDGATMTLVASVAVMLLTLAATLSRSGAVGLVTAVLVGTAIGVERRRAGVAAAVAAAVLVVAAATWINREGLVQRVQGTLDAAPVGRLIIWRDTLPIIRDFPVLGVGAGAFGDAMFVYQRSERQVLFNHAHDEYMQLATEGGGVLLIAMLAAMLALHRVAMRRIAGDHTPLRFVRIGAYAGLSGVAVQSVWDIGLHEPANLLLAAILAAIAVRPDRTRLYGTASS